MGAKEDNGKRTGIKVPNLRVNLVAMQLSTTLSRASRSIKSILKASFSTSATASSSAFMKARQITVGWMFRSRCGSACDNISPAATNSHDLRGVWVYAGQDQNQSNEYQDRKKWSLISRAGIRYCYSGWSHSSMVVTAQVGLTSRTAHAPRIITEVVPSPTSSS